MFPWGKKLGLWQAVLGTVVGEEENTKSDAGVRGAAACFQHSSGRELGLDDCLGEIQELSWFGHKDGFTKKCGKASTDDQYWCI